MEKRIIYADNAATTKLSGTALEAMMPYEEKAAPLLSEDSVAEILFTTGTTGNPKGACLSYRNIFASASNINEFIRNRAEDIEVLALPFFWLGTHQV